MYRCIQQPVCLALAFLIPPYHALKILCSPKMCRRVRVFLINFQMLNWAKDSGENDPRRTAEQLQCVGICLQAKNTHPLPKYIMLSGRKAFTRSKYCETSTSGTSSTETSCEAKTTTNGYGYAMATNGTAKLIILIGPWWGPNNLQHQNSLFQNVTKMA